jgi:hypothetical protein
VSTFEVGGQHSPDQPYADSHSIISALSAKASEQV